MSDVEVLTIGDDPFKLSYMEYNPLRYEEFLQDKINSVFSKLPLFITLQIKNIDIIRSPLKHFRQRCRFAISSVTANDYVNLTKPENEGEKNLLTILNTDCNSNQINNSNNNYNNSTNTNNEIHSNINNKHSSNSSFLSYFLWENGGPNIHVKSFPIASKSIYNLMPVILDYIKLHEELYTDLRAINFFSTLSGEVLATLVYERPIDEGWKRSALLLRESIQIEGIKVLNIIGRSHNICYTLNTNRVTEILHLADNRKVSYVQMESAFSNPNGHVNEKALDWICTAVKSDSGYYSINDSNNIQNVNPVITRNNNTDDNDNNRINANHSNYDNKKDNSIFDNSIVKNKNDITDIKYNDDNGNNSSEINTCDYHCDYDNVNDNGINNLDNSIVNNNKHDITDIKNNDDNYSSGINPCDYDLLELYCGNGNHTIAIAAFARRIVAVELNKLLCTAAEENLRANDVHNVHIVQCHSEGFAHKILKSKSYERKDTGEKYDFRTVLVDPPRSGLDAVTCKMISIYEKIIYISCNPESLVRDLNQLGLSHDVRKFAVFDQFAYTPHVECGVVLTLKRG